MQLEAQTYQRIQEKIHERVMNNLGTWIDWQYMQNAAKLLAKVRKYLVHIHSVMFFIGYASQPFFTSCAFAFPLFSVATHCSIPTPTPTTWSLDLAKNW